MATEKEKRKDTKSIQRYTQQIRFIIHLKGAIFMSNNRTEQFDMKVALDAAYAKIESLIEEKREMQKRISELEIREKERENSNTEMALAYQKACDKIDTLEKNYHAL